MTDFDKFLMFTEELTGIMNARMNLKPSYNSNTYIEVPRQYSKRRIQRLRLELFEVLRQIEKQCDSVIGAQGEKWY